MLSQDTAPAAAQPPANCQAPSPSAPVLKPREPPRQWIHKAVTVLHQKATLQRRSFKCEQHPAGCYSSTTAIQPGHATGLLASSLHTFQQKMQPVLPSEANFEATDPAEVA
jgi:hypothetical protein